MKINSLVPLHLEMLLPRPTDGEVPEDSLEF